MNKQVVVIFDFRNVIGGGSEEVILRHKIYAQILMSRSELGLHVHSRGGKTTNADKTFSYSVSENSILGIFRYCSALATYFRTHNLIPALLISGDPWESLVSARLFRFIYAKRVPIQVQFHGDIGARKWKFLNVRNFIRFFFTRFSLGNKSNMYFRSTSILQAKNLEIAFKISPKKNDVLPVGINLNFDSLRTKKNTTTIRIAFIGRLHKDRGTEEFVRLIGSLKSIHSELYFLVVGDGPEMDRLRAQVVKFPNLKIKFEGYLQGSSLYNIWSQVDVLLSLAPLESFGRTVREALISGTPVLAIPSSGILELNLALTNQWVQLIEWPLNSSKVVEQLYKAKKIAIPLDYRKKLANESFESKSKLVNRWIELARMPDSSKGVT
jgi:glycosyltransferase involved in cell wall biosynthesis